MTAVFVIMRKANSMRNENYIFLKWFLVAFRHREFFLIYVRWVVINEPTGYLGHLFPPGGMAQVCLQVRS